MAFCPKCGVQLNDGVRFCPKCGTAIGVATPPAQPNASAAVNNLLNTPDVTASFDPADINANKVMGVLAYLSILVLIPIFAAPKSRFARYHANQGLILLILEAAVNVVFFLIGFIAGLIGIGFISIFLGIIHSLLNLAVLALSILGIVNTAQGKAKPLPLIGSVITLLK